MKLTKAKIGQTASIVKIDTNDKTTKFLNSLGCFEGEEITLISKLAGNFVINIRDSRYAIDERTAKKIVVA